MWTSTKSAAPEYFSRPMQARGSLVRLFTSITAITSWVSEMPSRPAVAFCKQVSVVVLLIATANVMAAGSKLSGHAASASNTSLAQFISAILSKAKTLETSTGMRQGFQSLMSAYKLQPESIRYSDYVVARLLFEATRDAGFWNMHWTITDKPPNSDEIWRQWKTARLSALSEPTASAECDELSALYAFLVGRAGVRDVGLFWPTFNHTVAVWVLHPSKGSDVRVVVPTSQIFLDESDMFGTRKFDPWHQKTIHEYTRRDVADSFEFPKPLFDFFLLQVDKYAGASDITLQRIRYLREGVFRNTWTPEAAAREALKRRSQVVAGSSEDLAAFQNFAEDMRTGLLR